MVDDVWSLLEMTPYRYKTSQAGLDRVKQLERLEVTFEFVVTVYKNMKTTVKNGELMVRELRSMKESQYLLKMPFRMKLLNLILKVMKVLI